MFGQHQVTCIFRKRETQQYTTGVPFRHACVCMVDVNDTMYCSTDILATYYINTLVLYIKQLLGRKLPACSVCEVAHDRAGSGREVTGWISFYAKQTNAPSRC